MAAILAKISDAAEDHNLSVAEFVERVNAKKIQVQAIDLNWVRYRPEDRDDYLERTRRLDKAGRN